MRTLDTHTMDNPYCKARMRAAEFNPAFAVRATAAEALGISVETIKRAELGLAAPSSDIVAVMADAYNAPELRLWYCAASCPLGADSAWMPAGTPEAAVMRLTSALRSAGRVVAEAASILDDGDMTPEETEDYIRQIRPALKMIRIRADDLMAELDRLGRAAKEAEK